MLIGVWGTEMGPFAHAEVPIEKLPCASPWHIGYR